MVESDFFQVLSKIVLTFFELISIMGTMKERILYQKIWQKLSSYKNMVFLSGPRQSGKTTFAKIIARGFNNQVYFNWDDIPSKRVLIRDPYFFEKVDRMDESIPLVIFDEIHKYSNWKNYLKGVYDRFAEEYKILVTGSGRLDLYQEGGDSLAGRYMKFHLLPFTYSELINKQNSITDFLSNPFHFQEDNQTDYALWDDLFELSPTSPKLSAKYCYISIYVFLWSLQYFTKLEIRAVFPDSPKRL
jgi:predicted AAA+ superfamily ATPase